MLRNTWTPHDNSYKKKLFIGILNLLKSRNIRFPIKKKKKMDANSQNPSLSDHWSYKGRDNCSDVWKHHLLTLVKTWSSAETQKLLCSSLILYNCCKCQYFAHPSPIARQKTPVESISIKWRKNSAKACLWWIIVPFLPLDACNHFIHTHYLQWENQTFWMHLPIILKSLTLSTKTWLCCFLLWQYDVC